MITSILLALAGLLMIYFEFFLPGGLMGAIGSILLIASIFVLVSQNVGPAFLFLYVVALIILLFLGIKFALKSIKKTGKKGTIFLETDQEGFMASRYQKELVGKKGIVSSDLKPSGYVVIEDKYYQAVSKVGYIEKGKKIEIIGGQGSRLICKQITEE